MRRADRAQQHARHDSSDEHRAGPPQHRVRDVGFVRFIGGGLAPYAAGKLVERFNPHVPFLLGAVVVLVGAALLSTVHGALEAADAGEAQPGPSDERADAEAAVVAIPGLPEEAAIAQAALRDGARAAVADTPRS